MLAFRLWSYLTGYVEVGVEGGMVEKFINLAVSRGIDLWDIVRVNGGVRAKLPMSRFFDLRAIARRTRCRVRIAGKYGFPFFLRWVRRRQMLVVGAALFCLALYVLSSFVWSVEVRGLETTPEERVLQVAAEIGLKPGAAKWRLRLPDLEHELITRLPELSWVGLNVMGTRVVIEVIEKVRLAPGARGGVTGNIVAAKDGLVTRVLALAGKPVVKEGDTVSKGQPLILGVADGAGGEMRVRAKGFVEARVWYEGRAEVGISKTVEQKTGRIWRMGRLSVGEKEWRLARGEQPPFDYFAEEQVFRWKAPWRILGMPVELIMQTYYEVDRWEEFVGFEEAKRQAREAALGVVDAQVPPGARIVERKAEIREIDQGRVVHVRVVVETVEEIGTEEQPSS